MIQVSVPGKIHLIGEHTSVYGKPAILASINLYLHATISKSDKKEILGFIQYDNAIKKMQNAIEEKIQKKFKVKKIPNYRIEIDKSKIPVGSGLGTSASLSAAFTICLLKFLKVKYNNSNVFEIAFEGEKIFHGNPSGGDLAAVLNPGLTYFKKNLDGTKIIKPVSIRDNLNFLLIDSGKPVESTSEMVRKVSIKYQENTPSLREPRIKVNKIFDSQEELTNDMLRVLEIRDENKFISIIKAAEKNLERIGVVGENAKSIIRKIEKLNGAAKITGAGGFKKGSGMIFAYHKDLNKLIKFAQNNNLKYYSVEISDKGIKL